MSDDVVYTIYQHVSLDTGKSYVGLTKKDIDTRWAEHVYNAFDKRPDSKFRRYHFQDAIKKYGIDNWEHIVLQGEIATLDEACEIETNFIKNLQTLSPSGYNETLGGKGIRMTEEGKQRHRDATREVLSRPDVRQRYLEGIRRSHSTPEFIAKNKVAQKLAQNRPDVIEKKRKKMNEVCSKPEWKSSVSRSVEQLTKDGISIAMFATATVAAKATGVNYVHLCEAARGKRKSSGGFKWRYLDLSEKERGNNV